MIFSELTIYVINLIVVPVDSKESVFSRYSLQPHSSQIVDPQRLIVVPAVDLGPVVYLHSPDKQHLVTPIWLHQQITQSDYYY